MGSSSSRDRRDQQQQQQQQAPFYSPNVLQTGPQFAPQNYGGYTNGQVYGGFHYQGPPGVPPPFAPGPQQMQPLPGHYGQPPRGPPTHEYQQTQTIKNQVNLKKRTLRLQPDAGSSTEFQLQFAFDASAPCRVTTFLLATEDPRQNCKIVAATPQPRPPAHYQKGMDCKFPADAALGQQHAISLTQHSPDLLSLAQGDSYPLIIRLEALTDAAVAEGRQLEQMEVGGALPVWAQAQTTYARLRRDDEGHWGLQIIKQKIWVNGTSYELQEIYGMDSNRLNGSGSAGEDVEGRECVICMSAERDTTVLPCRHMCMCQPCASALKLQTNKCPICREEIESLLHIKIQRRASTTPSVASSNPGLTPTNSGGQAQAAAAAAAATGGKP